MPLPLLIGAPIIAAVTGVDFVSGILIGLGGGAASLGLYNLIQSFFIIKDDNQDLLDERTTPIAVLIEKLNAALINMPNYNLSQHGFFKVSFDELEKFTELDLKTDEIVESVTNKIDYLIKAKVTLEIMRSFLSETLNDARSMNEEIEKIEKFLTVDQIFTLGKIQELISENESLKDEIKQHKRQIKKLLKRIDIKLSENENFLSHGTNIELAQFH